MTFDNRDDDHNRPANGSLTSGEHAQRIEVYFKRCAERQFYADLNLARALQLVAALQKLETAIC
jgi:hypothetical protein